ncbi:hypothetical protein [Paremcibacter congregatus]|uniref:hypothetical protein n=1 Tax=Paremcibacter congregatus TaxID=2043170 RepID=UPI0030EB81D3
MRKNITFSLLMAGLCLTLTTGCSGNDEYIFEHGPAGPNTERTLESLPKGLQPDKVKASHTEDTLEPQPETKN